MSVRYVHDCDECQFLGVWNEFDLYMCVEGDTYIARHGDAGWEYAAGKVFVGLMPEITAAYEAAVKAGLELANEEEKVV